MNLKISEKGFRFRMTPADMENILRGQEVSQRICIGHDCFTYRISLAPPGGEMRLTMEAFGIFLSVPHAKLEELHSMGRSKSGLSFVQDGVEVSLQIDIRPPLKVA